MKNSDLERLSACIDEEVERATAAQVVSRILESRQGKDVWERYHLIGALLRGEVEHIAKPDFADSIQEKIASEPHVLTSTAWRDAEKGTPTGWAKRIVGIGIAASVALVTLWTGPMLFERPSSESTMVHVNPYNLPVMQVTPASAEISLPATRTRLGDNPERQRLLLEHIKASTTVGFGAFTPVLETSQLPELYQQMSDTEAKHQEDKTQ